MGIHYQSHLGCSFADVEEAWDQAPEPSPDLTSGETPQWGFASFAPERRSTNVVMPFPDCVSPHLELFLAQLAGPVRRAIRSFSSRLPSWSRSVWWPAFLRHAPNLLHYEHAFPALSSGALGTTISAPSYNTVTFPPLCGAPSVGVSSPGGGTRVPIYLVGDVVAY